MRVTGSARLAILPAAALVAALLAGACNAVPTVRVTRMEHQAFNIAAGAHTDLSVTTFNGQVSVTGKGEGTADVTVTPYGSGADKDSAQRALDTVKVAISQSGSTVTATVTTDSDLSFGSGRGADVAVFLPPDASLTLVSSNGRIEAVNVDGSVTATTSNGTVVTRGGHDLRVTSSNGSITMTEPSGQLAAQTSNASVDILGADSVVASVVTSNGALTFSGSLAAGDHTFRTTNASETLRLPAAQGFSIDGHTSNGSVTSDFAVLSVNGSSVAGSVGDSAARISAETSNGSLSVAGLTP